MRMNAYGLFSLMRRWVFVWVVRGGGDDVWLVGVGGRAHQRFGVLYRTPHPPD